MNVAQIHESDHLLLVSFQAPRFHMYKQVTNIYQIARAPSCYFRSDAEDFKRWDRFLNCLQNRRIDHYNMWSLNHQSTPHLLLPAFAHVHILRPSDRDRIPIASSGKTIAQKESSSVVTQRHGRIQVPPYISSAAFQNLDERIRIKLPRVSFLYFLSRGQLQQWFDVISRS